MLIKCLPVCMYKIYFRLVDDLYNDIVYVVHTICLWVPFSRN